MWKRSCFFFILIFSNHELINLLFVIHLFVRVFRSLSMYFLFFFQKCRLLSILLDSILLFFVLFNEIFIESIYLLGMYQNLCEFAQRTLFLNFNVKHMTTDIFLRFLFSFWSCQSDVYYSYFILPQQIWSMLYHGSVGWVQNKLKNTLTNFLLYIYSYIYSYTLMLFFIIKFLFLSWCTLYIRHICY